MIDLKPCPFCGSAAVYEELRDTKPSRHCIECRQCDAEPLIVRTKLKDAVRSWNTRAPDTTIQKLRSSEMTDNEPLFHDIRLRTDLAHNFSRDTIVIPADQVMRLIDKHSQPKRESEEIMETIRPNLIIEAQQAAKDKCASTEASPPSSTLGASTDKIKAAFERKYFSRKLTAGEWPHAEKLFHFDAFADGFKAALAESSVAATKNSDNSATENETSMGYEEKQNVAVSSKSCPHPNAERFFEWGKKRGLNPEGLGDSGGYSLEELWNHAIDDNGHVENHRETT